MSGVWSSRFGVHVAEDDRLMRTVRLVLWRDRGDGSVDVYGPDGTVVNVREDEASPVEVGWRIPREALAAFAEAVAPFSPSHAEVKGLQEALKIERQRVDRILDRGNHA